MPLEVNITPVEKHCTKSYVTLLPDKIIKTGDEALMIPYETSILLSNEHRYKS